MPTASASANSQLCRQFSLSWNQLQVGELKGGGLCSRGQLGTTACRSNMHSFLVVCQVVPAIFQLIFGKSIYL